MKKLFAFLSCLAFTVVSLAQSEVAKTPPGATSKTQILSAKESSASQNSAGSSATVTGQSSQESLSFTETDYDFGKIPQGKPVTHVFEFKNTGTVPFSLDKVQASCGCTTPEWNKDVIAPGATSKITVGYNALNEGPFAKPVTITYNGNQVKQIIIKGEVWKTPLTSAPLNSTVNSLINEQ